MLPSAGMAGHGGHISAFAVMLFIASSSALLEVTELVQWRLHRTLYEYTSYGAVSLERLDVAHHAVVVHLSSSVESSSSRCPLQNVTIFANQLGLPVVSRDKEVFPNQVFVSQTPVQNVTVTSNNQTVSWTMDGLRAGQLFLMAVMPRVDSRIKQQGLEEECDYFMSTQVTIQYYLEENISQLGSEPTSVMLTSGLLTLLSFRLPADVLSYWVNIDGCMVQSCPVNVSAWETLSVDMDKYNSCQWMNGSCNLQVVSPAVDTLSYLSLTTDKNISLSISVVVTPCEMNSSLGLRQPLADSSFTCIFAGDLGRETPRQEEDTSNFNDHFVTWDKNLTAHSVVDLQILDTAVTVARFTLGTPDTGTSLKVSLHVPLHKWSSLASIFLCLSAQRMQHARQCPDGASLNVTSQKEKNKALVIVPYPQSGPWFISMQSQCFHVDPNTSHEVTGACKTSPEVNMTVHLAPCVDGGCGKYGTCKLYMEADLLYSACNCYSGWRGYGCNDGSQAVSDSEDLLGVYLLTLSNLGFVPAICLAMYRRLYVETLVYSYNMFFSAFYHACDSSNVYQMCIMPYNALSFADFFASLLSFWVTLMAMARLSPAVRSFLHMLSALFISLGEVYNRHGLVEQLLPIAGGVFIVFISWARESYTRKALFPSKKRLLKLILPGVALSCMGLIINLALQTDTNYKYLHSLWHLLESLCILLLLPPRRDKSETSTSGNLSVQSGDITRQSLLASQEFRANIHPADDPAESSAASTDTQEVSSSAETIRLSQKQGFRVLSQGRPGRRRQNLIL